MTYRNPFLFILTGLLIAAPAQAGGPLAVEGSSGNTPVHYSPASVTLNFDIGTLGSRSNSEADALVLQAFALWNNVATSDLNLLQGADLANDIDETNYMTLLPNGSANDPSLNDNINPVIYDDDGKIIDDIFGAGASDSIAGFAASLFFTNDDKFKAGYAVVNGKLSLTNSDVVGLITHEMGHFVGLDHSQLNIDRRETDSGALGEPAICSTKTQDKYPMMYPFLCRLSNSLHVDDVAAISALYPESNVTVSFGQINGTFVDTSDQAILGANIWLLNTATGKAYSVVSDYLLQNTGFFAIYLPPGDYTLHANSVNSIFYGASNVGPYASNSSDISFQTPHPITAVSFEAGTPGSDEIITVVAGEAKQVKFVSDGSGTVKVGSIITPPESVTVSGNSGALGLSSLLLAAGLVLMRRRLNTHGN